jgi:hypothetical protein
MLRIVRGRIVMTAPLMISGMVTTLAAVAALFLVTADNQTTVSRGQIVYCIQQPTQEGC